MKNLFPRYADKEISEYQIFHPSQEYAMVTTMTFMENVDVAHRGGHGLTYLGPAGVGKTFLAEMVLKHAMTRYSVESIEAATYIDLHQERMVLSQLDPEDEAIGAVYKHIRRIHEKIDFVLFDDIGREHAGDTGWSNHLIFNALRFRSNHRLPFLVTSNLPPDMLAERYSEGFVSLLHEVTDIIVIEGEDYRCRKDS